MTKEEELLLEEEFNEKYSKYIRKLEEKNFLRRKKLEIKQIKKEGRTAIGLTTTKLLCYYLFITCNIILVYAMIAMWHFADLTYLGVIITDIVGQVLIYGIYSIRAFKDTQSEENIKLEREKLKCLPDSLETKLNTLYDAIDNLTGQNTSPDDYDIIETTDISNDPTNEDEGGL